MFSSLYVVINASASLSKSGLCVVAYIAFSECHLTINCENIRLSNRFDPLLIEKKVDPDSLP